MENKKTPGEFLRTLNLFDAVSIVAGAMIGSGIFIGLANCKRCAICKFIDSCLGIGGHNGCNRRVMLQNTPQACRKQAGSTFTQEKSGEITGFVYGWSLFLVIQTGAIAAVSVAFAKFLGILFPVISSSNKLVSLFGLSISVTTSSSNKHSSSYYRH
ncbi:MAG: hypothetical protein MZU97_26720 [Bacillus subtilis]|nr:hypothetical protein [Bacillus subtilis]